MKMKKISIGLFALILSTASFAQVDRTKMPEPGPAPAIKLGETQSFTLENGLKVFVVENHKLPRVSYSLVLDIDPIKEGDKSGTADLSGDLMSKGTNNRTKDEINFEIDFIGARFNTSATSVSGSSLKKHQEKLLAIMADVVKNPKFSQEELDKLKTQYISGIQSEKDDPDAISRNVSRVLMYGKDHPYGEITTEESIGNVTLDDVKKHYETFFRPNVAYLAVVGDITLKEVKPLITKYFADWKRGEVPTFTYPMPELPKTPQVAFVNKPGAVQSVISVFNPIDLKPGSPDEIKAMITNGILGGGFVSKLNLNLREEHAYTYGARSSIDSDELVGNFTATAKVRNEVTDSAITETMKEIMNMLKGSITEEELTAYKNYRTGTFSISLENPQTKARFAINTEKYKLPADYYANYLKNIEAVTLEDVKATSNKYLKMMNSYILVVGNKDEVAEKVKAMSPTGTITFYDTYGNIAVETLKAAPEGVTAESVWNKYITAIGGKANLEKVKSMVKMADLTVPGAPPLQLNMYYSKPNNFMSEVKAGEMVFQKQIYNGKAGRVTDMQGDSDMGEDDLEMMKTEAAMFPELTYAGEGFSLSLKGMDKVSGKDAYAIDVTFPNGDVKTDYYDVESGYLVKSIQTKEAEGNVVTEENYFGDYKKVGKIYFAHSIEKMVGAKIEMKISKIELNTKIDASNFEIK